MGSLAYVGKVTKFITKLFTDTNVNISYRTNNTTEKLLVYRQYATRINTIKNGIYSLKCPDCGGKKKN